MKQVIFVECMDAMFLPLGVLGCVFWLWVLVEYILAWVYKMSKSIWLHKSFIFMKHFNWHWDVMYTITITQFLVYNLFLLVQLWKPSKILTISSSFRVSFVPRAVNSFLYSSVFGCYDKTLKKSIGKKGKKGCSRSCYGIFLHTVRRLSL